MALNNTPLSYIEQFKDDTSGHSLALRLYPEHLNDLNTMLIKGPWHESFSKYILDNNIEALYLNFAHKWSCDDYSFLRNLKSVKRLGILDAPSTGLEALEEMGCLVDLSLSTYSKSKIDFTKLVNLKRCSLTWYKGTENILSVTSLTHLYIDEFKTKDFTKLAHLKSLEILAIKNSNIEDISCLSALTSLKKLELINCKKLTDFTPLAGLKNLEWLSVDGTKEVGNIEFVRNMTSLRILDISYTNNIESIEPLKDLTGLKAVAFVGNKTTILDGDLSYLTKLPNLALLWLAPRKHYSHKLIKQAHWDNFDKPDILLAPK